MAAWNSSESGLEELRKRWENSPNSHLFLQLAEEYRRRGDVQEALDVLRRGMTSPPSLAAEVALGRCLLEFGDAEAARDGLARAVQRDPTQMVAYRHLIEAEIQLRNRAEAARCLEVYRQLNPRDPDLPSLAGRIEALSSFSIAGGLERGGHQDPIPERSSELGNPGPKGNVSEPESSPPEPTHMSSEGGFMGEWIVEPDYPSGLFPSGDAGGWRGQDGQGAEEQSVDSAAHVEAVDSLVLEAEQQPEWPQPAETAAKQLSPTENFTATRASTEVLGGWSTTVGEERRDELQFETTRDDDRTLFSLREAETMRFDLTSLPWRPLSRADVATSRTWRGSRVSSQPVELATSQSIGELSTGTLTPDGGKELSPTATLGRLYREQGHHHEAAEIDQLVVEDTGPEPREANGRSPNLLAWSGEENLLPLGLVDFVPLRLLRSRSSRLSRRTLLVASYLDRLTEAKRHVS